MPRRLLEEPGVLGFAIEIPFHVVEIARQFLDTVDGSAWLAPVHL
jgi:type III secretory pathway component EscT